MTLSFLLLLKSPSVLTFQFPPSRERHSRFGGVCLVFTRIRRNIRVRILHVFGERWKTNPWFFCFKARLRSSKIQSDVPMASLLASKARGLNLIVPIFGTALKQSSEFTP
jgi:hypothetical protein